MTVRRAWAIGGLAMLAAPLPALAQAYQCRVPEHVSVPRVSQEGERRGGPITGYTFALSWSPEFCRDAGDRAERLRQCNRRSGWFGLIVHGLWPEGRAGRWPQWCKARYRPSGDTIAGNLCMTPSASLLARQWTKHGACMTRRPSTYYRVMRILWHSFDIPDLDRLSRKRGLTVGDLRDEWIAANPHVPRGGIGVKQNERGWLEEIRLCYGRDWMPASCGGRRYGAADDAPLSIWRGL
ncbi:ribonuclease T2 family protein [Pseudoblastomonas halimionae]|uniref:Ribonuclease T n=1 Tax=Alteriqipengyuania halimionae TaxID=1926630 RepID=A0A6I4U910_9SPHN|nr:ribonuclease T [Alteriqipengyuania halimionae]MXP10777.1 ribonuclease T [Alteriqipengyuania halimionae]